MQGGFEVKVLECYQPRGIAKLAFFVLGLGMIPFCGHLVMKDEETCGYIVYVLFFIIRLFAGWRYAGRIFNAGICRGKAISEFRSPKALPLHPHPLGHGSNSSLLCVLRC